jgi:hypothetical protein
MCPIDSENASVDLAHFDPKAVALQVGWRCIHFHFLDVYTHNRPTTEPYFQFLDATHTQ